MFDVQIMDINLTMPLSEFEKELQVETVNYPETMKYTLNPVSTKRGKNMYKLVVESDDGSTFTFIAEQDAANGNIICHPLIMQSINNSFYQVQYNDPDIAGTPEDPGIFFCVALDNIACRKKGTFAYVTPNNKRIISNGLTKSVRSIALVDNDGNVYACDGAKKLKGDTEDVDFSVNQPIGEWLNEHREIQDAIAPLSSLNDKANYIGKWLIQAKVNDDIDSDEFMDIFRQAGLLLGYTDSSIANIYKLLM